MKIYTFSNRYCLGFHEFLMFLCIDRSFVYFNENPSYASQIFKMKQLPVVVGIFELKKNVITRAFRFLGLIYISK